MAVPTIQQRIEASARPENRRAIMYQKWRELLFLHWEFPEDVIQRTLPSGLAVDTFNGRAFLGLVPFYMRDIRFRFLPMVPGVSNFLEMNLRTYVYDSFGTPGVWFYSLDANQWLAVRVARTLFHLPYFDARMSASETSKIDYRVARVGSPSGRRTELAYTGCASLPAPGPESLEFFLIERYYLFAANRGGQIFSGRVHHAPYPLCDVDVEIARESTIALAGFDAPDRQPDHAIMSHGVDVEIYALESA